jgi:hypothetical protein
MSNQLSAEHEAFIEHVDKVYEEIGAIVIHHVSTQGEAPSRELFVPQESTYPNHPA